MSSALFTEIAPDGSPTPVGMPARSARLPHFIGTRTADPDAALGGLRILLIGVGSVGGRFAIEVSRWQPNALLLVDRGAYKAESVLTQPILPKHVGMPKASTIGRFCKSISPSTRVRAFDGPVQDLPPMAFLGVDIVVLATDNLVAEIEVGQRCIQLGVPLIQASVHGDTLVSEIRALDHATEESPCLLCLLGPAEWSDASQQVVYSCEGYGKRGENARMNVAPTLSVSSLCSWAADMAALKVLRHMLGLGGEIWNQVTQYCAYNDSAVVSPISRNASCRGDHTRHTHTEIGGSLDDCSLCQLAGRVGLWGRGTSFAVGGFEFVEKSACACGREAEVRRFASPGGQVGRCSGCGGPERGQLFYTHRRVPERTLGKAAEQRLRDIGASGARYVVVRNGEGAALITSQDEKEAKR